MTERIGKILTGICAVLIVWIVLFGVPWPTFRIITNGKEFRIEKHICAGWYHPIHGVGTYNVEDARALVQKLTAEDKRIDAINDNRWTVVQ